MKIIPTMTSMSFWRDTLVGKARSPGNPLGERYTGADPTWLVDRERHTSQVREAREGRSEVDHGSTQC